MLVTIQHIRASPCQQLHNLKPARGTGAHQGSVVVTAVGLQLDACIKLQADQNNLRGRSRPLTGDVEWLKLLIVQDNKRAR